MNYYCIAVDRIITIAADSEEQALLEAKNEFVQAINKDDAELVVTNEYTPEEWEE